MTTLSFFCHCTLCCVVLCCDVLCCCVVLCNNTDSHFHQPLYTLLVCDCTVSLALITSMGCVRTVAKTPAKAPAPILQTALRLLDLPSSGKCYKEWCSVTTIYLSNTDTINRFKPWFTSMIDSHHTNLLIRKEKMCFCTVMHCSKFPNYSYSWSHNLLSNTYTWARYTSNMCQLDVFFLTSGFWPMEYSLISCGSITCTSMHYNYTNHAVLTLARLL